MSWDGIIIDILLLGITAHFLSAIGSFFLYYRQRELMKGKKLLTIQLMILY